MTRVTTSTGYSTSISMPEAFLTRTKEKNRGRFKIYNSNSQGQQHNNLYLDNGEEFEIEMFNPTTTTILAKVEINGVFISTTGLVLKPGQRVYLERYFDVDNRFKFDVYEVENWEKLEQDYNTVLGDMKQLNTEIGLRKQLIEFITTEEEKQAIQSKIDELVNRTSEMKDLSEELSQKFNAINNATRLNGLIRVYFYKEYIAPSYYGKKLSYRSNDTLGRTRTKTTTDNYNWTNSCSSIDLSYLASSSLNSTNSTTNTTSADRSFFSMDFAPTESTANTTNINDTKDTGRIEQGSKSEQLFEFVNTKFESFSFHKVEYKLWPLSERPMELKDLRQYCTQCGKKLKPSDNFCSSCGKKA